MREYIIRRLLYMIPTVLVVSIIVFFMMRLMGGDILDIMISEMRISGKTGPVLRAAVEARMGLDAPLITQYGRWIGFWPQADGGFSGIFQGTFGNSLWKGTPVIDDILERLPVTFELGLMGLIIAQLIALPIGIYSALRQDTWGDYIARSFALLCIAVPGFWIATLVIVFPAIWWDYMPSIFLIPFTEDPIGNLKMFIVPAIVLGMGMSGLTMRMTRTMMLEVLRQDYIRTAWGKGLRERMVVLRHALQNALIPVITIIGHQIPILVGGTIIIEQIFQLPGMGRLLIDASNHRDYPIVSAVVLVIGVTIVLVNLMVDLSYGLLDPRVRYRYR